MGYVLVYSAGPLLWKDMSAAVIFISGQISIRYGVESFVASSIYICSGSMEVLCPNPDPVRSKMDGYPSRALHIIISQLYMDVLLLWIFIIVLHDDRLPERKSHEKPVISGPT